MWTAWRSWTSAAWTTPCAWPRTTSCTGAKRSTPPASPSVWEQCAIILSEKTDDELVPYLTSILQWLYDLNWPGALTILNRLKNFSGKQLKKSFIDSVVRAINSHDEEEGMMWLDYLSELLDNKELKKELPEEILNILEKHYNHWGYWRNEI